MKKDFEKNIDFVRKNIYKTADELKKYNKNELNLDSILTFLEKKINNDKFIVSITENEHCKAMYDENVKTIYINKGIWKEQDKEFLSYIFLHEYYHFLEEKSSYFSIKHKFNEFADIFAESIFKIFGKEKELKRINNEQIK